MAQTIQLRNDAAANWTSANPVLAQGELGLETDTRLYKIGDGVTAWSALPYYTLSPTLGNVTLDQDAGGPPSSGKLRVYADQVGGRMMLKQVGPSGLDTSLQPAIFGNGMYIVSPGTAAVLSVLGGPAVTVVGTMTHPNLVSGGLRLSTSRAQLVSAATANSITEVRGPFARVWRGDAADRGGFWARFRFAFPSLASACALQRGFVGLTNSVAATAVTQAPSALTSCLGVGFDSGETVLSIYNNDAAGAAVKTSLGSDFPAGDANAMYDLTLFCKANDVQVSYEMSRLDASGNVEGAISTSELPASTLFLAPHAWINNGGTAAAVQLDLLRIYLETDS